MAGAARRERVEERRAERFAVRAPLRVLTEDGRPAAHLARALDIGLGGIRVVAESGPKPGTRVHVALRLAGGRVLVLRGRVAWSRETLHPRLFGSPRGSDDDAVFGVAFDPESAEDVRPIARWIAVRRDERRRARRLQRVRGWTIHA